jgi:hypothetical protein
MAQGLPSSSHTFSQFIRLISLLSYTSKLNTDCIKKNIEALKRKGMNAMPALLKFVVLLAIFLLASNTNAFTSLSPVAGSQVQDIQLLQL